MTPFLFAYGTLQKKSAPSEVMHLVKGLKQVGRAAIKGELFDLGEYPGAAFGETYKSDVKGTVFRLPQSHHARKDLLQRLDDYEGVNSVTPEAGLFIRKRMPVKLRNGKRLICWVYEYNADRPPDRIISSGVYAKPHDRRYPRTATG